MYCWRGGKRSGSLALVLDQIGFRVTLIDGGYKAFRAAMLRDLETCVARLQFQVVCGTTGSGKTRLLHALERVGAQVLDLEDLACHRSSVLGAIPGRAQPSQKHFDTLVWNALRRFDPQRPGACVEVQHHHPDDQGARLQPGSPRRPTLGFVEADVPAESYAIPFGEANIVRDGKHATIITYGLMVSRALDAAAALAKQGVECEVVDLRTLSPIDWDTVIDSAERTGHVVCVDEAHPRCSIAADVSAMITQECFKALKGPIQMVTAPHTPVPFSPVLEDLYIPSAEAIAKAVTRSRSH